MTLASTWSQLMNELRKNVFDPRCEKCTTMIDLLFDELLLQCKCRIDCPFMSLSTLWIILQVVFSGVEEYTNKNQHLLQSPNLILFDFILRFMSEKYTICLVRVGYE